MSQEKIDRPTCEAAVRTVAETVRAVAARLTPSSGALALADVADTLESKLTPPAKPEAKLEPLPTKEDWNNAWLNCGRLGLSHEAYRRVLLALWELSKGGLKIVDERGKGAEAERLTPTKEDYDAQIALVYMQMVVAEGKLDGHNAITARHARIELARLKKERAERFPEGR